MTVDEIYTRIGQEIVNVIESDNWTSARLIFERVGSGVVGYTGRYIENDSISDIDVEDINDDISDWINELHEITTEGGNNKWNRAIFIVTSEGKFDMELIWDEELNNEIERLSH